MKKLRLGTLILATILGAWLTPTTVFAGEDCVPYFAATQPDDKVANAVPLHLLFDQQQATKCLIEVIGRVGKRISNVEDVDSQEVQFTLLSATSAFRRVIADANEGSGSTGVTPQLMKLINFFRWNDGVDVVSALSYAARSNNRDLRLNSVLILGNIIDNSTVCIPLVHLNDSTLLAPESGVNGRANLLGIVSVVAPWAYRENFDSIQRTVLSIEGKVREQSDASQTLNIIKNIKERLAAQEQSGTSNRYSNLAKLDDGKSKKNCSAYVASFGSRIDNEGRANLPY